MNRGLRAVVSVALVAVVLSLASATASAQTPRFAGKWRLDWDLTDEANAKLGGPGEPRGATIQLTITQDAKEITIQIGEHLVRHFKLDGSESDNVLEGGRTMVSHASLEAGHLKIINKGTNGSGTLLYSISGDTMTEMMTSPKADGPGTVTTALVYRRVSSLPR